MICFMFPGQPLSFEQTLPADPDFDHIASLTRERTGFDLSTCQWTGKPSSTQVALQVYGTAQSLYRFQRLIVQGDTPGIIAEHSMGIYPALASCGALDPSEALELTMRIGTCIAAMGESRKYALGCITGLPASPLMAIVENNGAYIANFNTSRHFLVSGERGTVEGVVEESLESGAFSARAFPCDAPLHSPLMDEVAGGLREIVADFRFREPTLPLVSHIDQDYLTAADLPDFLVRELALPVHWERTCKALHNAGATRFVEVGVGDSLKKYNRWIATEQAR